ncbi:MAG: ABC transporter permease [Salibacteraceae bacterium]
MKTSQFIPFLRFLKNNKLYTSISVIGLGIGMASCILIGLYINNEYSYDQYHEKKDRIYRLTSKLDFNGVIDAALTNLPTGPTLLQDYPEVESFVRFRRFGNEVQFKVNQDIFPTSHVWIVDSTVFDVFSYPLVKGNPKTALVKPNSMVINQTTANRLFENGQAIGQSIKVNNSMYEVTAIMEDIPVQSDMPINALISLSSLPQRFMDAHNQDWFRIGFYTFLLFKHPVDIPDFESKLIDFEKKYVQPWSAENQIVASLTYAITPISELHFDNTKEYDQPKGNKIYLLIFFILAAFLLLISIINYINLNLAQGSKRSKEVGIRKTAGAQQSEIFKQFISESFLLSTLALIIGLFLVWASLPFFNRLIQVQLSIGELVTPGFIISALTIFILVTLLANSYPAILLSRLNPIQVLKGNSVKGTDTRKLNNSLLFIQFLFSLFMISGTIMVQKQMNFIADYSLGFDKNQIVSIQLPRDTAVLNQVNPWLNTLKNQANVVATSKTRMPNGDNSGQLMFRVEKDEKMVEQTINYLFVDEQFLEVLNLNLESGRNFNKDIATDAQQAFIVNKTAAETFGWYNDAVDKRVQWGLLPNGQAENDGKVIGVVDDFIFQSLHNELVPLVLCFNPNGGNSMAIRYNTETLGPEILKIQDKWNELAGGYPLQYDVLSTSISNNYQTESRLQDILSYFSYIAISLALIGLFALVTFSLQRRWKEIGLRKVLGADNTQLAWLIGKQFGMLLLAAFVVSTPLGWMALQDWLSGFAYKTSIGILPFLGALTILGSLSLITVSYHVWRISRLDPVKALRTE